jgi:hypothetical protein
VVGLEVSFKDVILQHDKMGFVSEKVVYLLLYIHVRTTYLVPLMVFIVRLDVSPLVTIPDSLMVHHETPTNKYMSTEVLGSVSKY